jgi:hypothetical protein
MTRLLPTFPTLAWERKRHSPGWEGVRSQTSHKIH